MRHNYRLIFVFILLSTSVFGQQILPDIQGIVAKDSVENHRIPREKLYMGFDKPQYFVGDTMWFSIYLNDALTERPSKKSGIVYVELFDQNYAFLQRRAYKTIGGTSFGQIALDRSLKNGIYHIRAYTNWMQNFGDSLYFQKDIPLFGDSTMWYMSVYPPRVKRVEKEYSVQLSLNLKNEMNDLLKFKDLNLSIQNKSGKAILNNTARTDGNGMLEINFTVPAKLRDSIVWLNIYDGDRKEDYNPKIIFPIRLKRQKIDFQFLPESGHLLCNKINKVAFKAIDTLGKPIKVRGVIKDGNGNIMDSIVSDRNGTGFFMLKPMANIKYYAEINFSSGMTQEFDLPIGDISGTILSVNSLNEATIGLKLLASDDLIGNSYYILGKSRGKDFYGAYFTFDKNEIETVVDKGIFPSGVCSFQLFKDNGQLVNERFFFVNHMDQLKINIDIPVSTLYTCDSIPFSITVLDSRNHPAQGSFSLSITDNSQVKLSPNRENILSYMHLSSDLYKKISNPYFFLSDTTQATQKAADNLMLTEAFVKYDWKGSKLDFLPEPTFLVRGKAINGLNKPVNKGVVTVVSLNKKMFMFSDSITGKDGKFAVGNFPDFDSATFAVQVKNKKGHDFGFKVMLNEFKPTTNPSFQLSPLPGPNINIDSTKMNRLKMQEEWLKNHPSDSGALEDVIVYAKAAIRNSKNLNGPGGYDFAVSTAELERMGDTSLYRALLEKIPSIVSYPSLQGHFSNGFYYKGARVKFIIDGIALDNVLDSSNFRTPGASYYEQVRRYLEDYSASDLLGLELMLPGRYSIKYEEQYLTQDEMRRKAMGADVEYAFLEITTRSGNGPFAKNVGRLELYRPQPFSYGKSFYTPKYKDYKSIMGPQPDNRSTILWIPQIITNKEGKASLYFYSAQKSSNYTISIEGSDLKGNFGVGAKSIKISPHP